MATISKNKKNRPRKKKKKAKRRKLLIILFLVLFFVMLSILWFVFFANTQQKSFTKIQTPTVIKPQKPTKHKKMTKVPNLKVSKPMLAILIDDVHSKAQIESIRRLGLKITPSIFPPYALSRESHLLSKNVAQSMVHLPMESSSKKFNAQENTLLTSFSDEQIVDRIMEIRNLFPKATYINNHTGSVFTSHYGAMKKLYIALKIQGFVFVDSLTSPHSKVKRIAHEMGDMYISRDVFIDNIHTKNAIHAQLRLAVKKAKKKGYAIAIGHPHKVTMDALASSKQILKDVKLVYLDDIYKRK